MTGPGAQHPHQQHQPPVPYPPQPNHSGAHPPGWIDANGHWQPGAPPPPPKKSSNGIVIALCIVAGLLGLALIGAVVASGDSSPSREAEALNELSERLDESGSDFDAINQLTDELVNDELIDLNGLESRCVATEIVDELGPDRSIEITAAEVEAGLIAAEADAFADAYVDCVDLRAFFARSFESDPATAGLPDFYVDCLVDELGPETLRMQFADAFAGNTASDAELERLGAEAGDRCIASFTPEQLDELSAS